MCFLLFIFDSVFWLFGAGFYIASFGSAFVASIVISIVSALVNGLVGNDA